MPRFFLRGATERGKPVRRFLPVRLGHTDPHGSGRMLRRATSSYAACPPRACWTLIRQLHGIVSLMGYYAGLLRLAGGAYGVQRPTHR